MPEGEPVFVLGASTLVGVGSILTALVGVIVYLLKRLASAYDTHVAELRREVDDAHSQHHVELLRTEERHRAEIERLEGRYTLANERLQSEIARLQLTEAQWREVAMGREHGA